MNADQDIAISKELTAADAQVAKEIEIKFPFFLCVLPGKQVWLFANCYLLYFIRLIRGKSYLNKFFRIKIAFAGRSASRRIR